MRTRSKQQIKKLIPRIIIWLQNLFERTKTNNYKSISLESLTPTCDSDDDDIYKSALKNAIDNKSNCNIGITGAYGSGKSSILESFIKNHQLDYHFLKISLASFNENNLTETENKNVNIDPSKDKNNLNKIPNKSIEESTNDKLLPDQDTLHEINQLIELSILQQLLYHVKIKDLPNSRFRRIKRHKWYIVFLCSNFFFIWLLAIIFISEPGFIKNTTLWKTLNWDTNAKYFAFTSFLVFASGCVLFFYQIIRLTNNSRLSKLNLKDGEIEIDCPNDRSILNRYLDEVFYFFEMTKHNVVIIEDLDRLKNSMIFTKLRELNILLNNSDQIKNSVGRIVFIYALRDDLFKDKSRTKFFDVIIPIIPIINNSNSGAKFLGMLNQTDTSHTLSKDIINDIFLFIGDMRLLKNIYNEYVIYREKIKKVPDQNKLLAIIVYKNIFPNEFVALHSRIGILYRVLKSEKHKLIENTIENIDSKIKEINSKIKEIKEILSENEIELRAFYINALWKRVPTDAEAIIINGEQFVYSELSDIDTFQKLITYGVSNYWSSQRTSNPTLNISFKEIEKELPLIHTYNERLELLRLKEQNEINRLKEVIEVLNKDKTSTKSQSIAEIAYNQDLSDTFQELKDPNNRLVNLLLRKGYIDENFEVYISFFHPGSLTYDDQDFVMSVICRESLHYRFSLTNKKEIVSKLSIPEFGQKEILNIELLDYLLINKKVYDSQINKLIDQLTNESKHSLEFIDVYIDQGKETEYFMNQLCHKWPGIWDYIDLFSNYSTQRKDKYLALIIKYGKSEDIDKINEGKRFSDYIKEQQYFLTLIPDEDTEKAKSVIVNLGIIFTKLEPTISESKLFDFIYENNYYEINTTMIEFIIKGKGVKSENLTELLERKNYSSIKASGCKYLLKYLLENINTYIEHIFLKLENNNEEEEDSILDLLNNEDIYSDLRKKIIIKNNTKLSDISKIKNKDFYPIIAEHSKMLPKWENIYAYLEIEVVGETNRATKLNTIDKSLTIFLNQNDNYSELSKEKISSIEGKEKSVIESLCDRIVFCQTLTINAFKSLHKSIPYVYKSLSQKNISDEKVDYMINSGFLSFTPENFKFLRTHYPLKHIRLIELYLNDFIFSLDKFNINGNDVLLILESKKFNENQKKSLIKSINTNIINGEKYVCNTICEFLISNKYIDLPLNTLEALFKSGTNDNDKITLFNLLFENQSIDSNSIKTLLLAIGHPFSRLTKQGITQKISSRKENKIFVKHLKRFDYNIESTLTIGGYIHVKTKKE